MATAGALQVRVLDQGDGRLRVAEGRAVLRDPEKSTVGFCDGRWLGASDPLRETTATRTSATATAIAPPNASATASPTADLPRSSRSSPRGRINTPADTPSDEWSALGEVTSLADMIE